MAFAIVQQKIGAWSSGTTFSITLDNPPTAGNRLVLLYSSSSALAAHQIASISGGGGTWAAATQSHATRAAEMWTTTAGVSGVLSAVVVQLGGTGATSDTATLIEVSGTVDTVISGTGQTANNTTPLTPDITPPGGHEAILFGFTRAGAAVSAGPTDSFNALTSSDGSSRAFSAYRVISAPSGAYHTSWTSAAGAWEAAIGGLSAPATLTFSTQPSNVTSGAANSPSIVVTSSDTTFTGTVTLAKVSGTGSVTSGNTATAVAGVATFNAFVVTGSGTWTISAAATGHTTLTSSSFTVSGAAIAPTTAITSPATGGSSVYGTGWTLQMTATPDTGRTVASYRIRNATAGVDIATGSWTAGGGTQSISISGTAIPVTAPATIAAYATDDLLNETASPDTITRTVTQYPLAIDYAARPFDFVRNNTAFTVDVAAPDGTVVTMAKGPTSIVVATGNTGTISGINTGTITGATATAGAVRAGYARFSVTALLSGGTNSLSSIAHNLVFSNAAGNCASTNSAWFWPTPRASAVLAALATAGSGGVPGGIQILTSWTWVGSAGFTGNASTDTWGIPTQVFIPYNAAAAGGTARGLVAYQTGTGGNGTYSGGDALLNRGQPTRPILVSLNTGDQWNQVLKTGGAANTTASIFAVTPQGPSTAADFKRQLMQMYTRLVPFLATDYAVDTRKVAVSGYSGGADTVTNNIKDFVDSNPRFFSCAVINDGGVPLQTVAGTSTGGLWGSALVVSQDDGEAAWATGVLGVNGVGLPFLFLHGGLSDAQVSLANGTGLNGPNAFDPFGWWSSHSNLNTLICKDPGGTIRTYAERTVFYPLPAAGVVQVTSATSSKFAAFAICVDTATLPAGGNAFPAATGVGGQWFTNGTAGYASKLAAYAALDAGVVVPAGQTYVGASVIQLNSSNGGTFDPAVCTLNGGVTPGVTLSEWVIAGPVATSGASAPTMQTQGQVAYQIAGTQYVLPAKTTLFSSGAPGTLAGGGAKVIAASQYAGWAAFADASGTITTQWSADASGEDLAHRLIAQAASPAGTAYIASGVIKAGASGWTPGTDCFTGGSGTKPCSSFRTFYSRGLVNHLVRLGGAVDFTPNATVGSITTTSPTSRYGYAVTGVENVSGPDHSAQQPKLVATDTGIMAWIDNWQSPAAAAGGGLTTVTAAVRVIGGGYY